MNEAEGSVGQDYTGVSAHGQDGSFRVHDFILMAGMNGVEPLSVRSERTVLPLNYIPIMVGAEGLEPSANGL